MFWQILVQLNFGIFKCKLILAYLNANYFGKLRCILISCFKVKYPPFDSYYLQMRKANSKSLYEIIIVKYIYDFLCCHPIAMDLKFVCSKHIIPYTKWCVGIIQTRAASILIFRCFSYLLSSEPASTSSG